MILPIDNHLAAVVQFGEVADQARGRAESDFHKDQIDIQGLLTLVFSKFDYDPLYVLGPFDPLYRRRGKHGDVGELSHGRHPIRGAGLASLRQHVNLPGYRGDLLHGLQPGMPPADNQDVFAGCGRAVMVSEIADAMPGELLLSGNPQAIGHHAGGKDHHAGTDESALSSLEFVAAWPVVDLGYLIADEFDELLGELLLKTLYQTLAGDAHKSQLVLDVGAVDRLSANFLPDNRHLHPLPHGKQRRGQARRPATDNYHLVHQRIEVRSRIHYLRHSPASD